VEETLQLTKFITERGEEIHKEIGTVIQTIV